MAQQISREQTKIHQNSKPILFFKALCCCCEHFQRSNPCLTRLARCRCWCCSHLASSSTASSGTRGVSLEVEIPGGLWCPQSERLGLIDVFLASLEMVLEKAIGKVGMVCFANFAWYNWYKQYIELIQQSGDRLQPQQLQIQVSCGLNSSQCATQPLAQCARAPMSLGPAAEGQTLEYLDWTRSINHHKSS